jgi:hypothetical protein
MVTQNGEKKRDGPAERWDCRPAVSNGKDKDAYRDAPRRASIPADVRPSSSLETLSILGGPDSTQFKMRGLDGIAIASSL